MPLVIPDCYLVSIKGQSGGQDIVNVIGVHAPGNTAISVSNAVLGAWKVAGGPFSLLSTNYQMVEVKAMFIGNLNGDVHTVPDSATATQAGGLATNGSCALITYGSGTRAKSTKGRMYFGPLREVSINNDGRTLVNAVSFTNAFTAFKAALEINNRSWVVLSRKNSTHSPIVSIQTQAVIGTQRRRVR